MNVQAPPPGSRTLCELQCRFVELPAGDRRALPGPTCPDANLAAAVSGGGTGQYPAGRAAPVVKCPSGQWPPSYAADDGSWDSNGGGSRDGSPGASSLRQLLQQLVRRLPGGAATRMERLLGFVACPPPGKPLAWHPSQPLLAAADSCNRVQIYDYASHLPLLGHGGQGAAPPPPLQPLLLLQHEFQQQASAAAWRPHGGKCLAVGVAHGVCLWHIGRPPGGSGSRSDSAAWMIWLKAPGAGPVATLAWHPQGHLLAAASPGSAGFHVWDVATGTATPISVGPDPVTLLRWSPCGTYLLAGHPTGDFCIWQTQTWWSQHWAAAEGGGTGAAGGGSGRLVEACWGPDCRSLLLAYHNSPQLVSLHFTGEPPSLQAQLLPLPLPELTVKGANGRAGNPLGGAALIQAMAWDLKAQRLAVAVGGGHPAAGCVALYDTRCDPILSARFIGFMRLGPLHQAAMMPAAAQGPASGSRAAAAAADGWEEIQPEEVAEAAGGASHGGTAGAAAAAAAQRRGAAAAPASGGGTVPAAAAGEPPHLAFLPTFAQGALLAAKLGDHVAAVPMYFAA